MMPCWISWSTGVWLGSLQVGFYLLLETHVTAAYLIYFSMVAVWLTGMMAGLSVNPKYERWLMWLALAAFYAAADQLRTSPRGVMLIIVFLSIAVCGFYSGQFFVARRRLFPHVGQLFWWENTGSLVGWVVSTVSWLLWGESALLWVPLVGFAGMLSGRWAAIRPRSEYLLRSKAP